MGTKNTDESLVQGPRAWGRIGSLWAMWTVAFVMWDQARPQRETMFSRFNDGFLRSWWDKDWLNALTATLALTIVMAAYFLLQAHSATKFSDEKVPRSYSAMGLLTIVAVVALQLVAR